MPSFLDPVRALDRDQLRALQLERLRATLHRVYANVPRTRAAFDAAGVTPADLRALEDLRRFPFTTKADLRDAYPFGLFAAPKDEIARIHASSGTTGRPVIVGHTRADIDVWADLVARSIEAAGGRPGMTAHVAYGYGLFTGGLGAHYGAERLGCTVVPVSGGQTERQVQLICDLKPEIIMVTPSYMLAILDELRRQGLDPAATSLELAICGAEPWSQAMRQEIEASFGIAAIDIYGLSEVMGPGVACEVAGAGPGPVIWEDHFLPEIVDPETGEPLPDGQTGELVFTTLTRTGQPMIRYRTRDLTRLSPGPIGAMRRMDRIAGRSDDMLIVRGVNLFPSQIEALILSIPELAPHYLIEISRPGRLDEAAVEVELRPGADEGAAREALSRRIKETIGIAVAVRVREPGAIARSQGKAVRVRDLRGRRP